MDHQQEANFTNYENFTYDETELWLKFFGANSPLIILALLIICINATILIVFVRKRPLKIATNFFLAAMALTDVLTGLITIPFTIACNATYQYREDLCHVSEPFFAFTSLSTLAFIATITADRYLAIMKPLRYKVILTKKRAKLIIAAVWVTAVFLALLPLVWVSPGKNKITNPSEEQLRADRIYTIVILCPIIMAFPLMVYTYIRIFKVIKRQRRLTREHERFFTVGSASSSSSTAHEIRTVTIFCVMLAGYVFCWAPFAVTRILLSFNQGALGMEPIVGYIIMTLPFVTSFLNPCCYGFGKRDFRYAISEGSRCTAPRNGITYSERQSCTTSC